jgi:DNA polymerase
MEVPPPAVGELLRAGDGDPRGGGSRHAEPPPAPQPPARPPQPDETLEAIAAELGACVRCPLSQTRRHIVYGVGAPDAKIVIIGEGPGRDEDLTGEPFVGRSGQLLNRMLEAIGLRREDAYICNVVKCRPPGNRDPLPLEVATCSPFLRRQVRAIGPRVILTVGRFAGQTLLGTDAAIGQMRRSVGSVDGTPVVATYHPSYLLRTPAMKARAWEDLLKVRRLLSGR